MNCGKVTLNPLDNELCEQAQIEALTLLMHMQTSFALMFRDAYIKMAFQSDHYLGDNGVFLFERAQSAGEAFVQANNKVVDCMSGLRDVKEITKSTYYEVLFLTLDTVIPAVKAVEQVFGNDVIIGGNKYSDALQLFIEVF